MSQTEMVLKSEVRRLKLEVRTRPSYAAAGAARRMGRRTTMLVP